MNILQFILLMYFIWNVVFQYKCEAHHEGHILKMNLSLLINLIIGDFKMEEVELVKLLAGCQRKLMSAQLKQVP